MTLTTAGIVTLDIVEDARWFERNGTVIEIGRRAIIHGIALMDGSQDQLLDQALLTTDLPQPGDTHPYRPSLILVERTATALGSTMASVLLTYKLPDSGTFPAGQGYVLSGGGSQEQISTANDRQGLPLFVSHPGFDDQTGEISPLTEVEDLAVTTIFQSANPWQEVRAFNNRLNTGTWSFDPIAQPRKWLCGPIEYTVLNGNLVPPQYTFTYHFRHNPDGWDPQIVFIHPETGRPPHPLTAGGKKTILWYFTANFNTLPFLL